MNKIQVLTVWILTVAFTCLKMGNDYAISKLSVDFYVRDFHLITIFEGSSL